MQIHHNLTDIQLPASACAIGLFDGVHIGHRMVLENALKEARLRQIPSLVVSFADHPQVLTSKTPTPLLSNPEDRLARFAKLGFDHALVPPFDGHIKSMPADQFIDNVLLQQLNVKSVTVGYDHRFGRDRFGDGTLLKQAGTEHGFAVHIIDPVRVQPETPAAETLAEPEGMIVSSTLIRKLLSYGDIKQSTRLLGRPYELDGLVTSGERRGRQLGFPTANLSVNSRRLIPGNGTYAGFATLGGQSSESNVYPAVCNIGLSPTFGDQVNKRVEVHLLDYNGSTFYGEHLSFSFTHKLRDEQKFESIDALISQIRHDCEQSRLLSARLLTVGQQTMFSDFMQTSALP